MDTLKIQKENYFTKMIIAETNKKIIFRYARAEGQKSLWIFNIFPTLNPSPR